MAQNYYRPTVGLFIGRRSAPCDRPDDEVRLAPRRHLFRQRGIRRLVGQVLLACEEPQHRPAALRRLVPDGAAQHRVLSLEGVEQRALAHRPVDLQLHFSPNTREGAQVSRQLDPDHASVCTCTDSTEGKSWTIAFQLSPASAETYTWPPVVPK